MGWFFLCLHLLLFHFPCFSSSSSSLCHPKESSALLQFKSSFTTNGYRCDESHLKTATWENGTDCCSWLGVTCDAIPGHVIGLNLGSEGLKGKICPGSTLFRLSHLQTLNLSCNDFSESQLHSHFGGFLSLTHLDLSDCNFEGEIPPQISHLSKLTSLHLSSNYGLVWKETTFKRLVQNATNLRELCLDDTNMSSIRPNFMFSLLNQSSSLVTLSLQETSLRGNLKNGILCLPGLQELYMSGNGDLQGHLPELSCSASLTILDLSHCQLQGPIPSSFSNLTRLTSLDLSYNQLNASIPSSLLTLPQLAFLHLYNNELSGQIPNVFHQSNRFQEIDLSDNRIGGELPSSLSNLQHLTHLNLSSNSFRGQIPDVFGGLTKLQELRLLVNNLEGQIPSSLFNLTQLLALDCSHNKLEGHLPNKITGFQNLTSLTLASNLLNGTIPSWCLSLPSLIDLDLSNNQFTGHISAAISSYSLVYLKLNNNKLQGNIPESIFNIANLTSLHLSSNNLSGLVNFQLFSKLQNLESLFLSQNSQLSLKFEGNYSSFTQLAVLDLSSVSLTEFPTLSGNYSSLQYLDLSNNKLNGRVPNLLLEMDSLYFLNLSQNLFTTVDQFSTNLEVLDLSFNLLAGDIPLSICNTTLYVLNLAHNKLTGIIPQCLANLSSLRVLDLQMNKLNGTLPNFFSKDSELLTLNLNDNQLQGLLPKSLSNCTDLEVLNLGNNHIEDTFPHWLQTLQNLKVLILRGNKLHGPIAKGKIKHPFPSLIIFDISCNNFSGPLPKAYIKKFEGMKNVTQVEGDSSLGYMEEELRLSYGFNHLMYYDSAAVTTKGINIAMAKIPKIFVSMDLSKNNFEGEIPDAIGELHDLKGLNLSHNRLTGPIPQSLGNLTNLESLDLSSNMLTGGIPAELICNTTFFVLNLAHNKLTGIIPQCFANLSGLEVLDLQMNKLNGTLPNIFSKDSKLHTLNLYGNQLQGLLPKSLSNCTNLKVLSLGSNHIEDIFPHWLQNLQDLRVLVLRDNKLHGPIAILKDNRSFPRLIIFDISSNNFSGPLPISYLKNFEAMKNVSKAAYASGFDLQYMSASDSDFHLQYMVEMSNNGTNNAHGNMIFDSVTMRIKGIEIALEKIPIDLVNIDLSNNNFEGEIPNVTGELHDLKGLNLSHNRLTGHIPQSLGNLKNLESLDLSSNILTGKIPAELTNLNFLEVLNLSHNHLVGEIPQGKQFNTFSNDSYEGDSGLCGFPLSRKCKPEQHSPPSPSPMFWSEEEKFGFGWKPVAIGYGCGMVFGVGLGCYVLKMGKPRWLVIIFGGQPNRRRVKRRTRMMMMRRRSGTMNQLVQMS